MSSRPHFLNSVSKFTLDAHVNISRQFAHISAGMWMARTIEGVAMNTNQELSNTYTHRINAAKNYYSRDKSQMKATIASRHGHHVCLAETGRLNSAIPITDFAVDVMLCNNYQYNPSPHLNHIVNIMFRFCFDKVFSY